MSAWEKYIREVEPYTPGEQPNIEGMVKLNTNECPYPPAPGVFDAVKNFDCDRMRLYPHPDAGPLTKAIADYHAVDYDNVFVGVGSDDVLGMAFLTFFNSELPVLFPNITYSFYDVWAILFKIPYKQIPLKKDFTIDTEDYKIPNGGIVIANPNAPTGKELKTSQLENIISDNPDSVVIVDEAYVDFGCESMAKFIDKYDNLLVVRTYSKSRAMAGVRIGYALGNKKLIAALKSVKFAYNSYTISQISVDVGVAALKDEEYFKTIVNRIINTRENAKKRLTELGFKCTDSKTNFIFATHISERAKDIFEYLKTKHVFVRYFNKPLIDNYLRISIGTDEEMDILYRELENYFNR